MQSTDESSKVKGTETMKWIDSHTHLYAEEFNEDREAAIERAKAVGIAAVLLPNIDVNSVTPLFRLCDEHPDFAFPMMGLHPTSVDSHYSSSLQAIEKTLTQRSYSGIGEIGIDLYWDRTYLKEQKETFEEQLKWSIDMELPVSIHVREAFAEVFDSIYKVGAERLKGVFHCFAGTADDLEEIKRMQHFKIGINGIITFKKSPLPEIIRTAPSEMLLLETDAPYLAPSPYRGKRNEPAYLCETAKKVAEMLNMTVEEVADLTRKNALALFNIPISDKQV